MEYRIPPPIESVPGPCQNDADGFRLVSLEPFMPGDIPIRPAPVNILRCKQCGAFGCEIRRAVSKEGVIWLCRKCFDRAVSENQVTQFKKLSKKEKKQLKRMKHMAQIQAKKEKRN